MITDLALSFELHKNDGELTSARAASRQLALEFSSRWKMTLLTCA